MAFSPAKSACCNEVTYGCIQLLHPGLSSFETKERKQQNKTPNSWNWGAGKAPEVEGISMATKICENTEVREMCKTSLPKTASTLGDTAGDMHCCKQCDLKIQVRCVSPPPYSPSAETILWLSAKGRTNFKAIAVIQPTTVCHNRDPANGHVSPASWANFTLAGWKACVSYSVWAMYAASLGNLSYHILFVKSVYMPLLVFQDHFSVTYQWRTIFFLPTCLCQNTGSSV